MNLLINDPPTEIEVGGIFYPIDWGYRNCLEIINRFTSDDLTSWEMQQLAVEWLFDVDLDELSEHPFQDAETFREAIEKTIWFMDCGDTKILNETKNKNLMSLEHDSKLIRSAIERTHHIRLKEVNLHWWEFCYMLMDLESESFLHHVIGIRIRKAKGKLTNEDRDFIRENPHIVNIGNTIKETRSVFDLQKELIAEQKRRRDMNGTG